jgi:hypothetical protein
VQYNKNSQKLDVPGGHGHLFPVDVHVFLPETKPLNYIEYLVGGLEPWIFMTFHLVANVIIPSEELIFFRGVGIPPARYV